MGCRITWDRASPRSCCASFEWCQRLAETAPHILCVVHGINNRLRFVVVDRRAPNPQLPYPNVVLRVDRWDDFGYKTMYGVSLRTGREKELPIGQVKILQSGQQSGRPDLSSSFDQLGSDFCSVGQDIEYYEKLMELPEELRKNYLRALRDAAYDPAIEQEFADEDGWETSLLRFGQAVNALSTGRQLVLGNTIRTDRLSFEFQWLREGSLTQIPFEFDDAGELPGRCHALIGYNGVGKTTLLADLALAASSGRDTRTGAGERSKISGNDTTFGAVVAVSYSAFDTFRTPESIRGREAATGGSTNPEARNAVFGYVYCGLRLKTAAEDPNVSDSSDEFKLKSINDIQSEFAGALITAGLRESGGHLVAAFEALAREPSFGYAGVDLSTLGSGLDSDGAIGAFSRLSTGHKIVLNIVTQLAAHLRTRSLVLIDEPETHLHPPLVAALLRAIQVLLKAHSSFAVIATHSPVVVQEIPSQYVTILERYGDAVGIRQPEIETFAENIGAITRHVFSLDSSATDYQGILASLSEGHTVEQISEMFGNGLSIQGRALVANYRGLP